jgi:lysophospholipase L1-like esterase
MSLARRSTVVIVALVAALAYPTSAVAAPAPPNSIASMGDSITRGFNACGFFVDCVSRSFSTGSTTSVNSHYLRIRAVNAGINGHSVNVARTGAASADMAGQASAAVSSGAQYVTMLIGANDACTSSEATMTPVGTFRDRIDAALNRLHDGLPNAKVLVISIPDLRRLWEVGRVNAGARNTWSLFGICKSMLANSNSTAQADVDRRARVRQRVIDFNGQLAAACAAYGPNCKYDGGAVFSYPFALSQVSTWDFFHPNSAGQAVLAQVTYAAGFGW